MLHRPPSRYLACWMTALVMAAPLCAAPPKHDKTVWNYDGGVFMETDGEIPGGACFRVQGRLTATDFFDNLKREDTNSGTLFRRGNDIVTAFPKALQLTLRIFDMPCDTGLRQIGTRVYLNETMIHQLRLSFFWKRGVEMRPARGISEQPGETHEVPQLFEGATDPSPQRYVWVLHFDVPSDGVPLTDSLVLLMRTAKHDIVARTAARM